MKSHSYKTQTDCP